MEIKHLVVGPILTNCYILSSNGEAVIIDPGDEAEKILSNCKDLKVKYIINTHYHYDHTTANADVKLQTGAEILIGEKEKGFAEFTADRYLTEGDVIEFGKEKLEVIETPGHSKGSICLIADDIIFTGDLLFIDGRGRTDLDGGDEDEILKSLARVSEIIKPGTKIYPGHGELFKALKE